MSELFEKCIEIVLKNEGGYQNNPNDSGNWVGGYKTGKLVGTKYGIAAKFFPDEDIKNLTLERAKELYYENYWLKMNLDGIKSHEAALQVFDFGVNAGTRRSIKKAQQIALVTTDGICGNNTIKAINEYKGDFVKDFKHVRKVYYEYIAEKRDNHVFLGGWLRRIDHTHF